VPEIELGIHEQREAELARDLPPPARGEDQLAGMLPRLPHPAAVHSITSSARASSVSGIWRPSALAVLRLMTISNLVGCTTGNSAGLTPLRILPA
jgi:hypothetical protein